MPSNVLRTQGETPNYHRRTSLPSVFGAAKNGERRIDCVSFPACESRVYHTLRVTAARFLALHHSPSFSLHSVVSFLLSITPKASRLRFSIRTHKKATPHREWLRAQQRPTLTGGNPQLPSALKSLTSVFGMGTGVTSSLSLLDWFE